MTDTSGDTISVDEGTSVTDTRGRTSYENWSSGWNWETPDGRTWDQNVSSTTGEETQIQDPTGATTVYGYDSAGDHMLEQITDPDGHVVDIGYNANGQVDSITQVIASGNGPTTTFAWQAAPAGVTVPSGMTAQYEVVETDPDGHATTYVDQYGGQTITTIGPLGDTNLDAFDPANLAVSSSTNALGDTSTNSFSSTTPVDQTTATAPPTATGQTAASDTSTYNTPSTVANYQFLPSSATDAEGYCTAYVYDTSGQVTDTYSGQSSPCDGHTGGIHAETRFQGDSGVTSCGGKTGEVCETLNGNGNATTYGYDSLGEQTSVTPPSPLHATTITYDSDSRIATVTDGNGTRAYSYDGDNRVKQVLYGGATTCTPSSGNCITYTYDADGNETQMVDNTGTTTWAYDQLGRLIKETPSDGTTNTCSSPNDAGIVYAYNDASNLISECSGNGTTGYAYDGESDLLATGTPITQVGLTQASGSGVTSVSLILPAELQANDQIILAITVPSTVSVTTPSGYTLVGSHSSSGVREVIFSRTAVSGDTTVTVSVSASTTVTAIAGVYRGVSTTTPVDATNSNGTTGTSVTISGVTTTGDSDKLLLAVGSVGTYSAGTGFNTPTNMYNDQAVAGLANRAAGLFSQTLTASGATGSRTFTFPTSSGLEGILIALTPANTTLVPTEYTYDAAGDRLTASYPDGVTQMATYNGAGDLASINAKHGTTTLVNYTYSWANGANDEDLRQSVTESVGGTTYTYTYDAWDRLTRAQETAGGSNNYQYTYDNDGNLLTQNLNGTTTTATYNTADQTCWAYVGTTMNGCSTAPTGAVTDTYDSSGNGNLTGTSAGFSASYNTKNQTTSVTPVGGSALAMTYGGEGQSTRTAAGSTSFINGELGIMSSTLSSTTTGYTMEPGGQLTSITAGGNTYYYLYDGESNVIGLVNSTGSRVATYTYDPYGNTTASGTAASLNPYRYQGGYEDSTGLYHYGDRYYNTTTDSWTQLDPSGQDPGYVYANDNPANSGDPTGDATVGCEFNGSEPQHEDFMGQWIMAASATIDECQNTTVSNVRFYGCIQHSPNLVGGGFWGNDLDSCTNPTGSVFASGRVENEADWNYVHDCVANGKEWHYRLAYRITGTLTTGNLKFDTGFDLSGDSPLTKC
jgi:RHS repeat-associated protein